MTDIRQNWIRKMSAFTVHKPSERSAVVTADAAHLAFHKQMILEHFNSHLFIFLVSSSVAGSPDMSLSIWSHCLRRNSNKVSQSSFSNSQVSVQNKSDLLPGPCSALVTAVISFVFLLSKEMFEATVSGWTKIIFERHLFICHFT